MWQKRKRKTQKKTNNTRFTIAFAGNPNVGKSTVFNGLTGMHQHTGNWAGKTVGEAKGIYTFLEDTYTLVDLPGAYSVYADSGEEKVTGDFLREIHTDAVVVVCDATALERSLYPVLELLKMGQKVIVCLNLVDEAEKKGIFVSATELSKALSVPVVETAVKYRGKRKFGYEALKECIRNVAQEEARDIKRTILENVNTKEDFIALSEELAEKVVTIQEREFNRDRTLDRVLLGKWGIGVMALLLGLIFWLTIVGSNYPSQMLSAFFYETEDWLLSIFHFLGAPQLFCDVFVFGIYRMVTRVVSVMLPPMAIFFPLFTLLEDVGYLPRMAFNLDKCFEKCHACGKQALTMCMGFGCNAAGVVGARIIHSPRERLIAILTNNFVPCNGRFPTLILLISVFFVTGNGFVSSLKSAALLLGFIILGVLMTLLVSKFLSKTFLKGVASTFVLELPPYRKPQIGSILVRSVLDRTLYVLGRAITVAAPAGLIVWGMANIAVGGESILSVCSRFLDPFGKLLGMDGVIIMAFILGFPANETVVPIMMMAYLAEGHLAELADVESLRQIFLNNGWTALTAINVMLFSLFHWPCSTTLLTIHKETGSMKWTVLSALIPTACGILICAILNLLAASVGGVL